MSAGVLATETAKLAAFVRRDLLILRSSRAAFVSGSLRLCAHVLLFGLIGQLVDPASLPAYGGEQTSYLEFVAIGALLSLVVGMLLERATSVIGTEQMAGTLEALLLTPVRTFTLQVGSAAFDAVQLPLRMGLFFAVVALAAGLDLDLGGALPAVAAFVAFVPFVWGLGLLGGAAIVTFRRGIRTTITGVTIGLFAGAYFPLSVLPGWLEDVLAWNPMAITLEAIRHALIGGEGWPVLDRDVLLVVPMAMLSLLVGALALGAAVARGRRRGTLVSDA